MHVIQSEYLFAWAGWMAGVVGGLEGKGRGVWEEEEGCMCMLKGEVGGRHCVRVMKEMYGCVKW